MKIAIEQPTLAAAVAKAQSVVEKRNTIPILGNVLIEAADGGISLRASDLDIEVTNNVSATVDAEGAATVPAGKIAEIVKKLPKGAIVTLESDEAHLHISAGRSKFSLPTLPVEDFPIMANSVYENTFTIESSELHRLLDKTRFAISTEETRYYLNGVYMHHEDGNLRTVATDGHRLALADANAPNGSDDMAGIIIPRKTVGEIIKFVTDTDDSVQISVSETKIKVEFSGATIVSKVIDGSFPDYNRVIPKDNTRTMTVDADDFAKAVDRVSTISTERSRAVKMNISDDSVVLSVRSPESGDGEDEVTAAYSGDPMDVGFNAKYLLEIVGQVQGGEAVFSLGGTSDPAIIRDVADNDALWVVMPMRT